MIQALVPERLLRARVLPNLTGLEASVEGVTSARRQNRTELNLGLWELVLQSLDQAGGLQFPHQYTEEVAVQ